MLSQIERGKVNPTYARLWNITQALGVGIDDLIEAAARGAPSQRSVEHIRPHGTPTVRTPDGRCVTRILSPIHAGIPVEWYTMTLVPGGRILAEAHGYGAWEHVTALDGRITVIVGKDSFELREGETIRYSAEQHHGAENRTARTVRCLLVVVARDELEGLPTTHPGRAPRRSARGG